VIDGKMERRRATTKRGAQQRLKELEAIRDARLNVGDGKQTVAQWVNHWLTVLLPPVVKPKTLEGHTDTCKRYVLPYLGRYTLLRLSAQHIDQWQAALRDKGLSEGTIANARRRLSAALEAARNRKIVAENVVKLTEPPSSAPREQTVLDEAQIIVLLDTLRNHRLYAFYALAAATGMRQGELFGLRWSAVDLDAGTLIVREQLQRVKDANGKRQLHRETPKGRRSQASKERTIHLSAELVQALTAHRQRQRQERLVLGDAYQGDDLVFTSEDGTPLEAGAVLRQLKRALKRAGLPAVTFHSLRHSAGSVILAHGAQPVDMSHVLGHSSVAITARIYAHSFTEGQRKAVAFAASALLRSA
jgi:integrase